MNRTEIGQGTLASTNHLLLRGFSCEFLGLFNQIVLYTNSNIHSTHLIPKEQYTIQWNAINKQTFHAGSRVRLREKEEKTVEKRSRYMIIN